jgi:hypothetical protein
MVSRSRSWHEFSTGPGVPGLRRGRAIARSLMQCSVVRSRTASRAVTMPAMALSLIGCWRSGVRRPRGGAGEPRPAATPENDSRGPIDQLAPSSSKWRYLKWTVYTLNSESTPPHQLASIETAPCDSCGQPIALPRLIDAISSRDSTFSARTCPSCLKVWRTEGRIDLRPADRSALNSGPFTEISRR